MPEKLDNERFKLLLSSWPERAIKYLYDYYHERLLRASEWRTHDKAASEDIVQEAIAEIWEKREWIIKQPRLRVENFLTIITINKSISYYRRINMIHESVPHIINGATKFPDDTELAEKLLAERDITIWKIIAEFPAKELECLTLKYKQSMSIAEIAGKLGVTKKAVERTITSAYKRLRKSKELLI